MLMMVIIVARQEGIVFIDEIDKLCNKNGSFHGADASSEGVQRISSIQKLLVFVQSIIYILIVVSFVLLYDVFSVNLQRR